MYEIQNLGFKWKSKPLEWRHLQELNLVKYINKTNKCIINTKNNSTLSVDYAVYALWL